MTNTIETNDYKTSIANSNRVFDTIADELSKATQKAYAQEMKTLRTYYEENKWVFYPTNNVSQLNEVLFLEQVLSYIQTLADEGKTFSTLNKTFAALKHTTAYEQPLAYSTLLMKPAKAFMEGLSRQTKTHTPKKAQALTVKDLTALYKRLNHHSPRDIRDKALISIGIATAMRSQSLADLTLKDVTPAISISGVNIHLRYSKTDQTGKGVYIPVVSSTKKLLDPVKALQEWLTVLTLYGFTKETTPDFPLFPTVRGQKGIQQTVMAHPSVAITKTLRTRLVETEIVTLTQVFAYTSHSLRSTFITLSNQAGVTEKNIAAISGHTDMTTLRSYDRTSTELSGQADYLNQK